MPDVVVVGAGPVGTAMASELVRHGVEVVLVERRPDAEAGSRAIGLHAPVLAALAPSGATERILARAVRVGRGEARAGGRVLGTVPFERLSRRFPFVATLPQSETEAALAGDAPAPMRATTVTGIRHDGERMRIAVSGPGGEHELSAAAVVVAAGAAGRGLAYRRLPVHHHPDRYLMCDTVTASDPAAAGDAVAVVHLDREGVLESFPLPGGVRRFVAWDGRGDEKDAAGRTRRLREALARRGEPHTAERVEGATAFRVRRAVAPSMRRGRLLVVGDAAHEVSPIGGQGMNLGLLDAIGLAPLLAAWVAAGVAPDAELERWERRRIRSARTAARLAHLNTALGRPLGPTADAARRAALRAALTTRGGALLLAHAYAMGFDRGA